MRGSFKTHVFLCLILLITMLAMGCGMTPNSAQQTRHLSKLHQHINNYIATYQARQDFEHFLSYYADDVQLEDMIYGFAVKDKQGLAEFFNWSAGNVQILDGSQTFTLDEVIVNEQQRRAVIRGTYVRFMYEGREMGPWRFTTVLHFNSDNKISYQQDWINYRPLTLTDGGSNLNLLSN